MTKIFNNSWSVWDGIADESKGYLKLPHGVLKSFVLIGVSGWSALILLYLLNQCKKNRLVVQMDEHVIENYCGCPRRSYFNSLCKLKERVGLESPAQGEWDMKPVLENLKKFCKPV